MDRFSLCYNQGKKIIINGKILKSSTLGSTLSTLDHTKITQYYDFQYGHNNNKSNATLKKKKC